MSLSPESAEHGVVPAVLEVVQSLLASAGALGSVSAERALLITAPSMAVSTFPHTKKASVSLLGKSFLGGFQRQACAFVQHL